MKNTILRALGLALAAGAAHAAPAATADPRASLLLAQTMSDAKGRAQALGQWKGKLLVVNFWATWCGPCVKEMPELSALASKGVQVLGVAIDTAENVAPFSARYAIDYPLYVAGAGGASLLEALGDRAGSLPFTLLIGRDGKVRKTYLGRLNMAQLRKDLAE
jgi:thiol-disulfide isomerase/thioredoxin